MMDEMQRLFKELQLQVDAIMPEVERAEINNSNVIIGKVKINITDFEKIRQEFEEILELPYETKINKMQYGFIPIALSNQNMFFKTIQISLNSIRKAQMLGQMEEQ